MVLDQIEYNNEIFKVNDIVEKLKSPRSFKITAINYEKESGVIECDLISTGHHRYKVQIEYLKKVKFFPIVESLNGECWRQGWIDYESYSRKVEVSNYGRIKVDNYGGRFNHEGTISNYRSPRMKDILIDFYYPEFKDYEKEEWKTFHGVEVSSFGRIKDLRFDPYCMNYREKMNYVQVVENFKKVATPILSEKKDTRKNKNVYLENKNRKHKDREKFPSFYWDHAGYYYVKSRNVPMYYVHELVAKLFLKNRKEGEYVVHVNPSKYWDNSVNNLKYSTEPFDLKEIRSKYHPQVYFDHLQTCWSNSIGYFIEEEDAYQALICNSKKS